MASSLAISDFSFVSFSLKARLLQLDRFRLLLPVGGELRQITRDALLQSRAPPFELGLCEILVSIVDCLELAAIDGHRRFRQQPHLAAQLHELRAHLLDGWAVFLTEI